MPDLRAYPCGRILHRNRQWSRPPVMEIDWKSCSAGGGSSRSAPKSLQRAGRTSGCYSGRPDDVASLRRLGEQSKSAPSQGVATTYDTINVHITPDRQSPSFLQMKEGEKVDVVGRRVAPHVSTTPPKAPHATSKERTKKQAKENKQAKTIPPPPMPPPPGLPPHWLELSRLAASVAAVAPTRAEEPKPVAMDDWSLIRNSAGESGWVLTRRLVMAIPDEVAQYAEGRRITSYFPLGETRDGAVVKQTWLWTTVEHGLTSYDFDSFRVFTWSQRHHRYETAHIERNVIGYFPVLLHPVAAPKGKGGNVPGFSILMQKKDGLRYRRNFAFLENTVKLASEEQVEANPSSSPQESGPSLVATAETHSIPRGESGFYGHLGEQLGAWRKWLFGHYAGSPTSAPSHN